MPAFWSKARASTVAWTAAVLGTAALTFLFSSSGEGSSLSGGLHVGTPDSMSRRIRPRWEAPKWTYTGKLGPEHWGELDAHYKTCRLGTQQSPIDIIPSAAVEQPEKMAFDYHSITLHALNNGHTIRIDDRGRDRLIVDGHEYRLLQMHFHAPSEHRVNHRAFDMEAHLVHRDANGRLAVVALPMVIGHENSALEPLWSRLPRHVGEHEDDPHLTLDLQRLLPHVHGFFHYEGSLTTPPCSEHVQWFVLESPAEISEAQAERFRAIVHDNARPTQPLNSRRVAHGH